MRRLPVAVATALALAACAGPPAGPTLATSAPPSPSASGSLEAPLALPPGGGFDYQLGGAYEPPPGTAIVARDSTDEPAPGLYNICYVNGFQSQPGEADAWAGLLVEGPDGPLADPGWPDEYLLDTSSKANRAAIAERMHKVILRCAEAGFDAVEFDNLGSFSHSAGATSAQENLALAALYIAAGHAAGLAVAQKNAPEIAAEGAALGFDFAVAEECGQYSECDAYLDVYEVVLDIEYASAEDYAAMCEAGTLPQQSVRRDLTLSMPESAEYVFERCS